LAIGDIHGCARALDALLELVAPAPRDLIVTLGDYVDRGPDSRGVLDRLVGLSQGGRLVALRGNHEELMMNARETAGQLELWKSCGGAAALRSYAPADSGDGATPADVPHAHWGFLDHFCRDYYETQTHIFVHACADPAVAMADQSSLSLRWEPFCDPGPHVSGKVLVCGHTIQKSGHPRNIGHAVCIDTGAFLKDGWLTCLAAEDAIIYRANQFGRVRASFLDEYLVAGGEDK
jgi:serine/threonine protein phosphatase 1